MKLYSLNNQNISCNSQKSKSCFSSSRSSWPFIHFVLINTCPQIPGDCLCWTPLAIEVTCLFRVVICSILLWHHKSASTPLAELMLPVVGLYNGKNTFQARGKNLPVLQLFHCCFQKQVLVVLGWEMRWTQCRNMTCNLGIRLFSLNLV